LAITIFRYVANVTGFSAAEILMKMLMPWKVKLRDISPISDADGRVTKCVNEKVAQSVAQPVFRKNQNITFTEEKLANI
jgi:hypothetical protein